MKKAVICGYYGQGNGGDEALLVSLLQMLPSQIQPIVLSANPKQTHERYGVESCHNRSVCAVLKALKASDLFIWGGGSLMQDVTSWTSPIYYAALMALAQQQGLKTIAWAQGIGPLRRPFTRWLTRRALLGCTAVSVRDRASAKLVSQWQINPLIAPDPVWALTRKSTLELVNISTPIVAVNLRKHPQLTPQKLKILTKALIDFQKATHVCLLLVPFQASQDLSIANSLASQLPGSSQIICLEDPRELKGLFREVEMTIGMRLHSLIMAAAEGSRCFALSYDPKVSRLMEEINLPGWKLTELPDDPSIVSTVWSEFYANGKTIDRHHLKSLVDKALMHKEIFKQIYE
ncbi:polysaccharide pyruvyl transferase CsaB [Cyanobacterium sp. uoEpiScrs1]|uniref:polysaccharide pyruvyl transferase CsaB n=1 Tax=Cyanobacterium sp. uoEpiScrs1 TaxID=2976343 RepID=UPI00226A8A68|nr:polysaccharide pyruvyl transferase CsaB [Cyanobacterium sp. uoEpiScrs1]